MSKFKLGAIITDASGTLGGHVVGKQNGYIVLKNKSVPKNTSSTLQKRQRLRTQYLMSLFEDLSNPQKKLWATSGATYFKSDIFGDIKPYTGFYLFLHVNQNRLQSSLSTLLEPSAHHVPTPPIYPNCSASTTEITIQSNEFNGDDIVQVYASKVVPNGVSVPDRYLKFIASASGTDLVSGIDVASNYDNVFAPLLNDEKIFLGFKTVSAISGFSNKEIVSNSSGIIVGGITPPIYDPDAQAFIDAVGTLTVPQEEAINDLVLALKANGTWSKYYAIYPFIGGTASAHKFNLCNPLDTDGAFRLVFNGGFTHSANGIQGNGTNAYANTFFTKTDGFTSTNVGHSIYSQTDSKITGVEYGVEANVDAHKQLKLQLQYLNTYNGQFSDMFNDVPSSGRIRVNPPLGSSGYFQVSRTSATTHIFYKNGVSIGTNSTDVSSDYANVPDIPFYICAQNKDGTGAKAFSDRVYSYASFNAGLTPTEIANDNTAVVAFQTALSRNV